MHWSQQLHFSNDDNGDFSPQLLVNMQKEILLASHVEKDNDLYYEDPSLRYEDIFGMAVWGNNRTDSIQQHKHGNDNIHKPTRVSNSKPPPEEAWLLHHSPLPKDQSSTTTQRIPRIINRMYFQKDGRFSEDFLPKSVSSLKNNTNTKERNKNGLTDTTQVFLASQSLRSAHSSWHLNNPNYTIRYFNLHSARQYLQMNFHHIFLRTFDCIQAFAGKSDFFRMALLYRDGGYHVDWKMECLVYGLLDEIGKNGTDFFVGM